MGLSEYEGRITRQLCGILGACLRVGEFGDGRPPPICHSREGGNPDRGKSTPGWVPACAGMTAMKETHLLKGKRRVSVSRDSPLVPAWRQRQFGLVFRIPCPVILSFVAGQSRGALLSGQSLGVSVNLWSEASWSIRLVARVQSEVGVYQSGWHVERVLIDRTGF